MERLRLRCPDYPNCSECPERSRIGNIETVQDLRLGAPSPTDTASSFSPFYYDHEHFQAAFPAVEEQPPQSKLGSLHDVALKVFCGGTESDEPPDAKDVNQRINAGHFETDSLESTSVRSNKAICNRPYISQISDFRACGNPEDSERLDTRDHFPHLEQKREDLEDTKAHGGMGGGDEAEDRKKDSYPRTLPLTLIIIGLCLSVFLISLDRTIITTAIPFITSEFNSPEDIGWYGSSYLLTASAFQPLYGRIFTIFNMKWSYIVSLGIFFVGSLICGIAPTSITLIIGRAIAGLGSAGILTGSFVVVSHIMPLRKRPVWTAIIGVMFGVGATVGPLLGGVFTDLVTWRWCFYLNLPIAGVTLASMIVYFRPPKEHALQHKSFSYRIGELDLIGNAILLGASIMLFLGLQYTEQQIPWSSPLILGLLVGAGVTFIVFCIWQWWKADSALIPPRILKQRSVLASCVVGFFIYAAILIQTYYLPIWFQAVKGYTAIQSGVAMIPYVAANAVASLLAGFFVTKNGYFTAPAIIGCAIGTVGCGLISTITPSSSSGMWIGFEILASAGIGLAIQQGFSAVQIVLPLDEVSMGTAAVVAFQSLGGAIFVSVGNTILQNDLLSASHHNKLPGVNIQAVIKGGASEFRKKVPPEAIPELVAIYVKALQKVFIAAIPMAGLALVAALFLEWKSVKGRALVDDEAHTKKGRAELEQSILQGYRKEGVVRSRPLGSQDSSQTEMKEKAMETDLSSTLVGSEKIGVAL